MAFPRPVSSVALTFETLPIEIQRDILLKHFEDPCTVTFRRRKSRSDSFAVMCKFGNEALIALTSKYLFNETVWALKSSPHTILEFHRDVTGYKASHIDQDETVKSFARHTRTIRTPHFFFDIGFAPYQRLAPNLRAIILPCDGLMPFAAPELQDLVRSKSLYSIVQGWNDDEIVAMTRDKFTRTLNYWLPTWKFRDIVLTFCFCFSIEEYWQVDTPIGTELRKYQLALTFEVSEYETTIIDKTFQMQEPAGDACQVKATEVTMDRLTKMESQYVEKAAIAMSYFTHLPGC